MMANIQYRDWGFHYFHPSFCTRRFQSIGGGYWHINRNVVFQLGSSYPVHPLRIFEVDGRRSLASTLNCNSSDQG